MKKQKILFDFQRINKQNVNERQKRKRKRRRIKMKRMACTTRHKPTMFKIYASKTIKTARN